MSEKTHPKWGNITIAERPDHQTISIIKNPDDFYKEYPAWKFERADKEQWTLKGHPLFWSQVYDTLTGLESQTWEKILLQSQNNNHPINPESLNKVAKDRLSKLNLEVEALYSLRITGKVRIYGYFTGKYFSILWLDDDHGDNKTCVCRSVKR